MLPRVTYRSSKRRWLAWSVAVLIIAGAIGTIQMLNRWAQVGLQVHDSLNSIETLSARMSALEWQAAARAGTSRSFAQEQNTLRVQLDGFFDQLDPDVADNEFLDLRLAYNSYARAVDEMLRLLHVGQLKKALDLDRERVDPNYEILTRQLGELRSRYARTSRGSLLAANSAASALLLVAAIAVGILLSRFERSERSKQLMLAEQTLLRFSEQRLRSLVHNSSDILAILNPLPPTINFVSESSNRILGRRADVLTGLDICQFIHPDDVTKMQRFLGECAFRASMTHTVEVRFRHGSGHWIPIEILGDNRMEDEAIRGIVIVLREKIDLKNSGPMPSSSLDFDVPSKVIH